MERGVRAQKVDEERTETEWNDGRPRSFSGERHRNDDRYGAANHETNGQHHENEPTEYRKEHSASEELDSGEDDE